MAIKGVKILQNPISLDLLGVLLEKFHQLSVSHLWVLFCHNLLSRYVIP